MANAESLDVVVIGSGPGGYVCAIRAAQLGMKVACVEKRESLGGTCLNVGCIPSKALLQSSEKYDEARHTLSEHGVEPGEVKLDLAKMLARKDKVVDQNTKGVAFLFKKNKIAWIAGTARIKAAGAVEVALAAGGTQTLSVKHIIIATGSDVMPLPGIAIDEKQIASPTAPPHLAKLPK